MDCGRGSLVKLCGLRWMEFFWSAHICWLHTTPVWERYCQPTSCLAGHPHCSQPKYGGCWLGKVQIRQLGQCLMWPLWLWHGIEAHVVMLSACIGRHVYSGPLGRYQMTVLEIIIAVLHHFVRLCNCCCEFGLCQ